MNGHTRGITLPQLATLATVSSSLSVCAVLERPIWRRQRTVSLLSHRIRNGRCSASNQQSGCPTALHSFPTGPTQIGRAATNFGPQVQTVSFPGGSRPHPIMCICRAKLRLAETVDQTVRSGRRQNGPTMPARSRPSISSPWIDVHNPGHTEAVGKHAIKGGPSGWPDRLQDHRPLRQSRPALLDLFRR